jgi:thioredoxin-related protein
MRVILSVFVAFPLLVSALIPITEDYSKAQEIAQDHNRPLLILFTGSDWCQTSQEMISEFKADPFEKTMENQFILVQADYPELNHQQPKYLKQNKELKEKYGVESFPTLVMTDIEGKEITRLGSMALDPKQFAEHLRDLYLKYTLLHRGIENLAFVKNSIEAIEELYKSARELRCPHYIEKLMNAGLEVDEGVFFPLEKYAALVQSGDSHTPEAGLVKEKIIQRDPENREMSRLRLALLDFQANEEVEPIGTYISDFGSADHENLFKLQEIISEYFKDHANK